MKKLLFVCLFVSSCACLFSLALSVLPSFEREQELFALRNPYHKIGPSDPMLRNRDSSDRELTILGRLANFSDIIAIGRVATQNWTSVVINVETPLVGCINGQQVIIKLWPDDDPEPKREIYETQWLEMKNRLPTNDALIVFSAYSNETYRGSIRPVIWGDETLLSAEMAYNLRVLPITARPDYRWHHDNRSWWYTDRDNGVLLEHFTNIVHTMRIERNWTNYVHLCRDGNFKDSIRVREDSFYDLREFARRTSAEQANYFFNDPLILPELKEYLFEKHPNLKPKEE